MKTFPYLQVSIIWRCELTLHFVIFIFWRGHIHQAGRDRRTWAKRFSIELNKHRTSELMDSSFIEWLNVCDVLRINSASRMIQTSKLLYNFYHSKLVFHCEVKRKRSNKCMSIYRDKFYGQIVWTVKLGFTKLSGFRFFCFSQARRWNFSAKNPLTE